MIFYNELEYLVAHRVVEIKHKYDYVYYITKGDGNDYIDEHEVYLQYIVGKIIIG